MIHENEKFFKYYNQEWNDSQYNQAKEWLKKRNIGFDFEKNKSKLDRMKKDKLKQLYIASVCTKNYGDISLANKVKIKEEIDLFTYSSPCFLKGTLILTNKGLVPIELIKKEDYVLTHTNTYKKVITPMINYTNHIYEFNCMASPILYVTEEHPFYVRERYRVWDNVKRAYVRKFKEPSWVKVKNLTKDYYVGTPINNIEKHIEWEGVYIKNSYGHNPILKNEISNHIKKEEFWWLVGRFIGDGWVDNWDKETGGIKICSANTKTKSIIDVKNCLDSLNINYSEENCKTVVKFNIHKQEYKQFFKQFGNGAENKFIPQDVLNLPKNLLKSLLDGYWSADGFVDSKDNKFKATSVSKKLVLTLAQAIHKVYNRPTSVYRAIRPPKHIIENRIINQKDTYTVIFSKNKRKQDKAFYEDGFIWSPIKSIIKKDYSGHVYNFEVEEDNSYVAENVIVHNCQSFSIAGKQEGLQGVSGLLLECEKFIELNKPKFLLLENVKNLVSKKFIKDFENWLKILDKLGYNSYYKILNAKDFNVPQNRERVFCLSVRKDIDKGYEFPIGNGINKCIQDVLDDNIDNKYYLKQEIIDKFVVRPIGDNIIGTTAPEKTIGQRDIVYKPDGIMGTLTATDYKQPKQIIVLGDIDKKGWFDVEKRVYDKNGLSPTLTTNSSSSPKIITLGNIMPSGHSAGRVVDINGISPTVMENHGLAITVGENINNNFTIRRLTPRECWKLMDFDKDAFDKVKDYISDSQLYKQAGNSIVVACLEHIFQNLKNQYNL